MTNNQNEKQKVILTVCLALIACLLWGYNYILARQISSTIHTMDISFWRWVIAAAVLFPFARPHFKEGIPKVKEKFSSYFYLGFLSVCVYNILFFKSAFFTSANNIALIGTTSFIWTIVVVAIMGIERITIFKLSGCILAFSGAIMVISHGHLSNLHFNSLNWGDLMMAAASLTWGIYAALVKIKPHKLNQSFFLFTIATLGSLTMLPIYLINVYYNGLPQLTGPNIFAFLYVGIFVSAISWACYNYCIEVLGPVRTSVFFYLLPIIVALLSAALLDEHIKPYHITGFILVVSGIVVSNLRRRKIKSGKAE